ncbi:proteasome assembly chaperone family protein [Williamsia sterculiae]|uniref:Predicted ATP-dependent carboligase, ATP-grasp superfamily n=1 Tax=Williamsia sterculiae TaxID=1344003 RepID=A0A1N7EEG1_9NOCA|nr:PAC2 family protein [Williamsia sterculiae]SIR86481.1 Predicted ATP-dependent carboligase, ATP-grasp superfamily [Williamsia sterculiae]
MNEDFPTGDGGSADDVPNQNTPDRGTTDRGTPDQPGADQEAVWSDDTGSRLYELEFPAPEVTGDDGDGPVLVHALEGFADAGHAVALAAEHLRDALDSELVATFSGDELIDYRSRRPTMQFSGEQFTGVEMPLLQLHAIRDNRGRPFLLLSGVEPDLRWEQFVDAVRRLSDHFEVATAVGLNAIPMAVPHTRPSTITAHGNAAELLGDLPRWGTPMKVPASASMLLELRLGDRGYRTAGLSVHVPHYLSQSSYPAAAAILVQSLATATGLDLPVTALENAAAKVRTQIDAEVSGNDEVESVVTALEAQYDTYAAAQSETQSLLARDESMPSGDELGAELERFLAAQTGDDRPDDGESGARG